MSELFIIAERALTRSSSLLFAESGCCTSENAEEALDKELNTFFGLLKEEVAEGMPIQDFCELFALEMAEEGFEMEALTQYLITRGVSILTELYLTVRN